MTFNIVELLCLAYYTDIYKCPVSSKWQGNRHFDQKNTMANMSSALINVVELMKEKESQSSSVVDPI